MKKLLFIIAVLSLMSCDSKLKECTYEVYQSGKVLPGEYKEYIRVSEWCESHSKYGVVYKLKDVKVIKVKDLKK